MESELKKHETEDESQNHSYSDDLRGLEIINKESSILLSKQSESYRATQNKAGMVIGIMAFFVPILILNFESLESMPFIIIIILVISFFSIGIAFGYMILALKTNDLYSGHNTSTLKSLVNEEYEDILLNEIGVKCDSFDDNNNTLEKLRKYYGRGLIFSTVGMGLSMIILIINVLFCNFNEANMSDSNKTVKTVTTEKKEKPQRVVPKVPPEKRSILNEGEPIKAKK